MICDCVNKNFKQNYGSHLDFILSMYLVLFEYILKVLMMEYFSVDCTF